MTMNCCRVLKLKGGRGKCRSNLAWDCGASARLLGCQAGMRVGRRYCLTLFPSANIAEVVVDMLDEELMRRLGNFAVVLPIELPEPAALTTGDPHSQSTAFTEL